MKRLILLLFSVFAGISVQAQGRTITNHPLYPFSKYSGDTVAYLTRNFDGGANGIYDEQPLSKFLQAMDPAMPIRTFYPRYYVTGTVQFVVGFDCFVYTKRQLKKMIKEGKTIYGITLWIHKGVGGMLDNSATVDPELFEYIRHLGLGQILPWTPELQQKIGHLNFSQGVCQDVTPTVKRYLEYHP